MVLFFIHSTSYFTKYVSARDTIRNKSLSQRNLWSSVRFRLKKKKQLQYSIIKNYKWSDILPYLQTNKLAWQSFMDADRRYETPGSERKDLSTQSRSSSQSIRIFLYWFPKFYFLCTVCCKRELLNLGNLNLF